jgi:hypothetical protein
LLNHCTLASFLLLAFGLGACDALKGPEITLSADKTTIASGGFDYAEITATLRVGGALKVGGEMSFVTESGSFSATDEDMQEITAATDSTGKAVVKLYSPRAQGQTQVTVSYDDETTGETATERLNFTFGPPQAGDLPVAGQFHLTCLYLNVGAFRQPKPDIIVPCQIDAQTIGGNAVPVEGMNLFFLAEAGVLEAIPDAWSGETTVRYRALGGHTRPLDVDPVGGEPSRTGQFGETMNPRDGLVSLLAIVRGSESFIDLNANGVREDNEPYEDLGEPFLDVDDDGVYTPGVDEFFDTNNDGEWTPANGQYDVDTFISAQTKIVWTGPIDDADGTAARIETVPASRVLGNGGSLTLAVYLLDKNLNPLVAFGENDDSLEFTVTGNVNVLPQATIGLGNKIGMTFSDEGEVLTFEESVGRVAVTVADYDPAYTSEEPEDWSIYVSFYVTVGPSGDDGWIAQEQGWFLQSIDGTVR